MMVVSITVLLVVELWSAGVAVGGIRSSDGLVVAVVTVAVWSMVVGVRDEHD